MKKINIMAILAAIVLMTGFNSCKHGENDPFLSMRSRDARLKGLWKLESVTGSYINKVTNYDFSGKSSLTTSERKVTFAGGKLDALSTVNGGNAQNNSGTYALSLEIKSGGECHTIEEYTPSIPSGADKSTTNEDNGWFWMNNSKNKDQVFIDGLVSSKVRNLIDPTGATIYSWYISGLKNKTLEFTVLATKKSESAQKKSTNETDESYNFVVTFTQE